METYLPMIRAMFDEWLQLTIDQPLYAAALVISVWLLTAILYSFKISSLKKKNLASEKARTTAETQLSTAQQQYQQAQDDARTVTEQLAQQQQETQAQQQRASTVEQQLAQRNQQIASIIQRLANSFDIGERPLPVTEDPKAEELWQQNDKVINKLIETLRTEQQAKTELQKFYQAEQAKVTASEARLSSLQITIDSQASLVVSLQTQNSSLQQNLADSQRQQQTDSARLLELEQGLANPVKIASEPIQASVVETHTDISSLSDNAEHLKSLFKKPEPQPISEPETIQPITTEVLVTLVESEPVAPEVEVIAEAESRPPIAAAQIEVSVEPEPIQKTEKAEKGVVIKGWYNKLTTKKSDVDEVVSETVVKPEPIPVPAAISEKIEPISSEKTSAVKGLLQKLSTSKSKPIEITPTPVVAPVEKTSEKSSIAKGLLNKFSKPTIETVEIVPVAKPEEPVAEKIALSPIVNKAPAVKPVKPESHLILDDDRSSGRIEAIADKLTDTVEGVKGLFGKVFKK